MTSKAHWFKNAMLVYAAELIRSTGVLGFQTFKFDRMSLSRMSLTILSSAVSVMCHFL